MSRSQSLNDTFAIFPDGSGGATQAIGMDLFLDGAGGMTVTSATRPGSFWTAELFKTGSDLDFVETDE